MIDLADPVQALVFTALVAPLVGFAMRASFGTSRRRPRPSKHEPYRATARVAEPYRSLVPSHAPAAVTYPPRPW